MQAARPFTVLTAELLHETNTFCQLPTTLASFAERGLLLGDEAIAERQALNTELGGFLEVAHQHGWQVTHTVSAHAQPGGRVSTECFEQLLAPILAAAQAQRFDGILLGLHGAMVTQACDDGEGELLARLRAVVGPRVPIAITLDPHANVSRQMCDLADIMVSFKTYPHTDMREAGRHAAQVLRRTMAGEIRPRTLRVSRPMLEEANSGRTDVGPMVDRIAQARAYEATPDVFAVSVNGGFANAAIAELGPTVLVTAQGDMAAHAAFAQGLADDMWARRAERINQFHTVDQAAALCLAHSHAQGSQPGPIVVADYADNPGAGAYGDSTALLAALLQAGVQDACFGAMVDPEAVQVLMQHTVGEQVTLPMGGKTDARFGGAPLQLTGRLLRLSDGHYVGSGSMIGGLQRSWGPTAVLQVDGITILVVTHRAQMLDLEQFKAFGIHPEQQRVVAVKSMQHFRAAFEPIASQVIVCDSGALATLDYTQLPFAKRPRPLYPFETDIDIAAWKDNHAQGLYLPVRA
jgi:microcystin degradation protein MlrC